MAKILFYADTVYGFGGVQRVLAVIAKALSENHDVTILTIDTAEDNRLYGYAESGVIFRRMSYHTPKDISYYCCKAMSLAYKKFLPHTVCTSRIYRHSFFLPRYKRQLVRIINDGQYDIVVGVHAFLSLHLASVRHRLKAGIVVGWMHNSYYALFEKKHPYLPGLKSFFSNEMKQLDRIVVLSQSDASLFSSRLQLECTVIHNPLTLVPKGCGSFHHRHFLAVGRFTHGHKGFDILIAAFAKFALEDKSWVLDIVGEGEDETLLRNLIIENRLENRVFLHPFTNDIQQYYTSSSFYILSSRWEGQPLVLIEAMSFGLPVIASNLPICKELLSDNQVGWLFPNGDITSLARLMADAASSEDRWDKLSSNARIYAATFSLKSVCNRWESMIFH